ncbi:hypothetical protein TrRE_jg3025 [Triparma retinervis]|uniref:Uncharacterized protein n=1 Tax=Triparma retinervis TaxID=2557542 RepID=A0A9W7FEJ2_9STRA|nr:hypothetical protein TrRE_jg3025 [Triparma retinervis]
MVAVPNLPSVPKYTVLTSSYSTFKDVWAQSKNYALVSTAANLTEAVAGKAVSMTSKYTKASTLKELDIVLRPALLGADIKVSPYIVKGLDEANKQSEGPLAPVVNVAKKVLPIQTAATIFSVFMGIFTKNMEKVGRFMLIENPEVVQ